MSVLCVSFLWPAGFSQSSRSCTLCWGIQHRYFLSRIPCSNSHIRNVLPELFNPLSLLINYVHIIFHGIFNTYIFIVEERVCYFSLSITFFKVNVHYVPLSVTLLTLNSAHCYQQYNQYRKLRVDLLHRMHLYIYKYIYSI